MIKESDNITDIEPTSNQYEYALSTNNGLRFATIKVGNVKLNEKEDYFKNKQVMGAPEYKPNKFIVFVHHE
jgi:hypothetical protein